MPDEAGGSTNQVSSTRLKLSYWYVSNKLRIKQILIGFLILLNISFYGFSLYYLLSILLVDGPAYRQGLHELTLDYIDYPGHRLAQKALDLQIVNFTSLPLRNGNFDFIASIRNPNPDFVAESITYQLISGSQVLEEKTSFVLPNEEKFLAFFDQKISVGSPILKISNVKWRRVHFFDEFAKERLQFEVSNIDFKNARESGIRGELPVSTLNFDIKNNSAFSYWEVGVYMTLQSQQRIVGANFIALDQFLSGQTRHVEMRWYDNLPSVNNSKVFPEVNIVDPGSYMPVQ